MMMIVIISERYRQNKLRGKETESWGEPSTGLDSRRERVKVSSFVEKNNTFFFSLKLYRVSQISVERGLFDLEKQGVLTIRVV